MEILTFPPFPLSFASGFENELQDVQVLFMRSDGGLTPMDRFAGSQAIVSGATGLKRKNRPTNSHQTFSQARPAAWWATRARHSTRRCASR